MHAYMHMCGNMYPGHACVFVQCEQARFSLGFTY